MRNGSYFRGECALHRWYGILHLDRVPAIQDKEKHYKESGGNCVPSLVLYEYEEDEVKGRVFL
jgi:hypothetical protein